MWHILLINLPKILTDAFMLVFTESYYTGQGQRIVVCDLLGYYWPMSVVRSQTLERVPINCAITQMTGQLKIICFSLISPLCTLYCLLLLLLLLCAKFFIRGLFPSTNWAHNWLLDHWHEALTWLLNNLHRVVTWLLEHWHRTDTWLLEHWQGTTTWLLKHWHGAVTWLLGWFLF